jgi:acyl dehydratase
VTTQEVTEIGRSARFEFPVERGKILEFARALKSESPVYRGSAAIAPPTFLIVGGQIWGYSWEHPGDSPLASMGVDPAQQLHLEETYEYFGEPPRAGTTLEGELVLLAPVEKVGRRSGRLSIITTRTTFRRADGTVAAAATQVIAQLHEQHREHDAEDQNPDGAAEPAPAGWSQTSFGPVTLEDVVQYQAASGDLNPHHYDPELLRSAGFTRFFVPGMFGAGLLGAQVADTYGAENVRRITVRFNELIYVGDRISCAISPATQSEGDPDLLEVEMTCLRPDGKVAISGMAIVAS